MFPGLRPGEQLTRDTRMPERATIGARDGTPIAEGEARLSKLDPLASEIAGRVGPAPPERADELAARGVPDGAPVGLSGLEREFDAQLAGTPGGELLAGERVLATTSPPHAARACARRSTPTIQRAAVEALAGRYGGIAAVRPRTGEVLALAGVAFSAPQPPGSVFKIVTLTARSRRGTVQRNESFPVQTAATLEGVELQNAHGESCGGSLIDSFAHSCNSVFAPIGAELGAEKLVAAAERVRLQRGPAADGRRPVDDPGGRRDRRRPRRRLDRDRPGQGADHAAPDGADRRGDRRGRPAHASRRCAAASDRLEPGDARARSPASSSAAMRAVVKSGTGVGAALKGVVVAGKTGTAELRSTVSEDPVPGGAGRAAAGGRPRPTPTPGSPPTRPSRNPRIAVAVLLIAQGAGGEVGGAGRRAGHRRGA